MKLLFYTCLFLFVSASLFIYYSPTQEVSIKDGICINLPEQMRIDVQDSIQIFKKIKEERCLNE